MQIMRAVGLPYEDLNDVLKAVKASNDKITEYAEATFERVEPIFIQCGCNNLGLSIAEGKALWKEVLGFTDYGFNKAHATNYGLRGYRMAYLKAHYPAEFMAATLSTWSSTPKEAKYVQEARKSGFRIARPDVNLSGVRWTIDGPGQLRKGLMSIKGVGDNAAPAIIEEREANGPYIDATDFSHRLPAKKVTGSRDLPKGVLKGVCKALAEAGALRAIGIQP